MGPLISAKHRAPGDGLRRVGDRRGRRGRGGRRQAAVEGLEGGFFVQPTVIRGVRNEMKVAQEEIFGPVLSVITWKDEDALRALANDVDFGLVGGIWTADTSKALRWPT